MLSPGRAVWTWWQETEFKEDIFLSFPEPWPWELLPWPIAMSIFYFYLFTSQHSRDESGCLFEVDSFLASIMLCKIAGAPGSSSITLGHTAAEQRSESGPTTFLSCSNL